MAALNTSQIRWAEKHNWFVQDNFGGTITVNEVVRLADGTISETMLIRFDDFKKLYYWAGFGRRSVYYRDTMGRFDRLIVSKDGRFNGFAPCSEGQQRSFASLIDDKK